MKTTFSQPRFTGARFEEHTLPVEVAQDLVAYETLIIDLAKHLYRKDHPGRQRLPKGFASDFRLDIERIDPGSARPVLSLVLAGALGLQGEEPSYFERARDLVAQCVDAPESALLEDFPKPLLSHFNHLGRSLREDEALELPLPQQGALARLTLEKRKHLVLAADRVYERETTLTGWIEEAAFPKQGSSVQLRLSNGGKTEIPISESLKNTVRDCLGRSRHQITVKGVATFDSVDRLQKVLSIESLDVLKNAALSNRLDEIALLENGWFEGGGLAPDANALTRVAETLIASYPEELLLPLVIPKQDGNLLLEWDAEGQPSLDIDLAASKASFHAFGLNDEDIERDFDLDARGWVVLFAFLVEQIRGGTHEPTDIAPAAGASELPARRQAF